LKGDIFQVKHDSTLLPVDLLYFYHMRIFLVECIIVRDTKNLFEAFDLGYLLGQFLRPYLIHILCGLIKENEIAVRNGFQKVQGERKALHSCVPRRLIA